MRFIISLFITLEAIASPINLSYEGTHDEAQMYREILMKDYLIPDYLISLKRIDECNEMKAEGKLDLCLKNNGDLLLVSVDRAFINESLKVFRAP